MKKISLTLASLLMLAAPAVAGTPSKDAYFEMYGNYNRGARWHNANTVWHKPYAHPYWRQPVALIVPPVANMQTSYSWGVGRTRMVPNYHQFTRPYVAPGGGGGAGGQLSAAPNWPSSTDHQGVYYIRGPW